MTHRSGTAILHHTGSDRSGVTLVELLVGLFIAGILLAGLVGVFIGQSRLFGEQESQRTARDAVGSATGILMADLRRVEATQGVEDASAGTVTIRVPFAMGLVCASSSTESTVALLPADSIMYARAGFSGYAWRESDDGYSYVTGGPTLTEGESASACTSESIEVPGDHVVRLSPGAGTAVDAGTPLFLYQRVRYEFRGGGSDTSLFRTVLETGEEEELVRRFADSGTRFRFFVDGSDEAQDDPPSDLGDLRGLELVLEGMGDRPRANTMTVATAAQVSAVFFKNRPVQP